jgi:hypothetical protein
MLVVLGLIFNEWLVGFGVPILVGIGLTLVSDEFKKFQAARMCFIIATVWVYGRVLMWSVFTSQSFYARAFVTFLAFGIVGVILTEGLRAASQRENLLKNADQQMNSNTPQNDQGANTPPPKKAKKKQPRSNAVKSPLQANSGDSNVQQQSTGDASPNINQQGAGNTATVGPKFNQNISGSNNVGIQGEQINIGTGGRLLTNTKYLQLVNGLRRLEKGTAFLTLHEPITKEMSAFGGQLQSAFKEAGWDLPAARKDISNDHRAVDTDSGMFRNTPDGLHCVTDGSSLSLGVIEVLKVAGIGCVPSMDALYPTPVPKPTITLFLGRSLE